MSLANGSLYTTTVGGTPGIVALAVTLFVGRYYWKKGKETKALGWTPLGISRIVTRPVTDVSKGLQLTWAGKGNNPVELETPYIVKVRITNVGSKEIAADEGDRKTYQKSLSIGFKQSQCYEAIITEKSNEVILVDSDDPEVIHELPFPIIDSPQQHFEVMMPALNRSSWVDLVMIADGRVEYPNIDCNIAGESQRIKPVAGRQRALKRSAMLRFIGLGAFIVASGFALYAYQSLRYFNPSAWPTAIIAVGAFVMLSAAGIFIWSWTLDRQEWATMKRNSPDVFELSRERRWFEPGIRRQ
jgi:hypothetical protein